MVTTLSLLACALAVAQTAERPPFTVPALVIPRPGGEGSDWPSGPHLAVAQEMVYRGSYTEESVGGGVQFARGLRLEARVFVLDLSPQGADIAFLTVLRPRGLPPGLSSPVPGDHAPGSVRLELGKVDNRGRLSSSEPGVSLTVPLDGPPVSEFGVFLELPAQRVGPGQSWAETEDGRPNRAWEMAGNETVNGTSCLKLVGRQQSADWDRPRADQTAWRRVDTVWLAPRLGVAYRVGRVIERRDPGREGPGWRSVLRYELESSLPYPRQLYADRHDEILKIHAFQQTAGPLLAQPSRHGPELEALLAKINHHLDREPPTPYREALLQLKRRAEAAQRGESPPAPPPAEEKPDHLKAEAGHTAPDFLAPNLVTRQSVGLRRWAGRVVVLVFYNPASVTAEEVLYFAQAIQDNYRDKVAVVGMVMSSDVERARKQHDALHLTIPLLDGTGLRQSYEVEATPKVVVVDAAGVVRGGQLGWGQETPAAVLGDLKKALRPPGR
jgi:peroxiredoxin